jgi:predicted  nucleic acid-binding Zn-ribbon protein
MIDKILLIVALVLATVSMFMGTVVALQGREISRLKERSAESNAALTEAHNKLSEQNTLIEAYRLDIENAKAEVYTKTVTITEYAEKERIKVIERLVKDNSCEERLRIIEEEINAFLTIDF